jgi:AraC-like DNA-binding protein
MATRDLLYYDEHATCRHYISDYTVGFAIKTLGECEMHELELSQTHRMIFLIDGVLRVKYDNESVKKINAGEMFFVPKSCVAECQALSEAKLLISTFDIPTNICDKLSLQSYWTICRDMEFQFRPHKMRPQMKTFIDNLAYYLDQKIRCANFFDLKQKEMFLIFRWFYSKEELAELFFPMIGRSLSFKSLILENYLKVSNVNELAEMSHMGRSTFDNMFKHEFGMPAMQWILKQKAKHVKHELLAPDTTISDVMLKFGFNSSTHFTRFCRQQFGCTPSALQAQSRNG